MADSKEAYFIPFATDDLSRIEAAQRTNYSFAKVAERLDALESELDGLVTNDQLILACEVFG